MVLLVGLLACGDDADVATVAPSALDATWVATVAREPARFEALIGAAKSREGWISLHKNAWVEATGTKGAPAERASAELAVLHGVLADVSNDAWRTLGATWELRGTLPMDSAFPTLVALAAKDAGDNLVWARWLQVPRRADAAVDARVAQHEALRRGEGDPSSVLTLASAPLVSEPIAGGSRALWDPMVHLTLSLGHGRAIADGYPTDVLERTLFSGTIDPADGAPAASLAKLGLALPLQDDADACRELVRAFDRQLDPWKVQLVATAPDAGKSLLTDLRLVEGLRARALVDWGVDALGNDRPRCALAFAEMALDHEHPREITPLNPPTLFALSAAANLRTGRSREALDALEVLRGPFPETMGLDETVGDLAVLQGLDRAGDSREQ
ncbi:MAG: hypothetical protein Q8P18_31590 [Pseudomonadota bacterium]|nr:hypothetical protein [Pseudomonadota bacterium]